MPASNANTVSPPKKTTKNSTSKVNTPNKTRTSASRAAETHWDSDLEILDGPVPSPAKKTTPSVLPVPGSPAFKNLDPVSINEVIAAALRATNHSPSLEFGSVSDEEDDKAAKRLTVTKGERVLRSTRKRGKDSNVHESAVGSALQASPLTKRSIRNQTQESAEVPGVVFETSPTSTRPQRQKIKTEKAQYSSLSPTRSSSKRQRSSTKIITSVPLDDTGAKADQNMPDTARDHPSREISPADSASDRPHKKRLFRKSTPASIVSDEDEDLPLSVSVADALKGRGNSPHTPPLLEHPDNDASHPDTGSGGNPFIDAEADDSPQDNDELSDEDDEIVEEEVECASETGSVSSDSIGPDVTLDKSLQDKDLYPLYQNLPVITNTSNVVPFGGTGQTIMVISFGQVKAALAPGDLGSLIKALAFTSTPDYANASRINPELLYLDLGRYVQGIKFRASKKIAFLVMNGSIIECHINAVGKSGPESFSYPVHAVTIAPFAQEWLRDTAVWGSILGFDSISSTVSEYGVQFTTKRPSDDVSIVESPKKPIVSAFASPIKLPIATARREPWQYSRAFSDRVPIYDGRVDSGRPFEFTDSHFRQLQSWPLWRNGDYDLPIDSMVSVGYTVNSYRGASGKTSLSMNLQFVILMALPKDYKDIIPTTATTSPSKRRK